jgi:hypothetical protein
MKGNDWPPFVPRHEPQKPGPDKKINPRQVANREVSAVVHVHIHVQVVWHDAQREGIAKVVNRNPAGADGSNK